ncbi:hypothetical protein Prede_1306 [Prevotella dentalis DSM 3688]|uniref:DUF7619 domain-containing protein n=2 Tax=Prevotellaceae TaxID=171552 RepID=L0JCQ0_PREDD|nr:hypothetical protein [Prevotella dentalis]AGB28628.1 hypothetical protein Prede_1306 [Prevotella dentalis DSM 3688]
MKNATHNLRAALMAAVLLGATHAWGQDAVPDNTWKQAQAIETGTAVRGQLGADGDTQDWYKVTLTDDGDLDISAAAQTTLRLGGTGMNIANANGDALEYLYYTHDMDNHDTDTTVVFTIKGLAAGTYYFDINRYAGHGGYTLTTKFTPCTLANDTGEPGNADWKHAVEVEPNQTLTGRMGYKFREQDKKDWYKVTLTDDGDLDISAAAQTTLRLGGTGMNIANANGDALDYLYYTHDMDNHDTDTTVVFTIKGLAAGTYYFDINRYAGHGGYTLTTKFTPCTLANDAGEPDNNDWNGAVETGTDQTLTGRMGYKFREHDVTDWYKVTLPDDGDLDISAAAQTSLRLGGTGMNIANANGDALEYLYYTHDMNNHDTDTTVVFTIKGLAAGTYYFDINRYDGYGGYTLTTKFTPCTLANDAGEPGNADWTHAVEVAFNQTLTGRMGYKFREQDKKDWYKVTLPADGDLTISAAAQTTLRLGGTGMNIANANGDALEYLYYTHDMDNHDTDTTVVFTIKGLAAGTYYFDINRYAGHGGYTLTTKFTPCTLANDAGEPGNADWKHAVEVEPNQTLTGRMGYKFREQDKKDWYKVTLPDDGDLDISAAAQTSLRLGGTGMNIANGDALDYLYYTHDMDNHDTDTTVVFTIKGLAAGTYYFDINRYDGYGGYTLTTKFTPCTLANDAGEPGNADWTHAVEVAFNQTLTGRMGYKFREQDKKDWYKVTLPADGDLTISAAAQTTLRLGGTGMNIANGDALDYLYYNHDMDNHDTDTTVVFTIEGLTAGTYYFDINRYDGYGGYTLNCQFEKNPYDEGAEDADDWQHARVLEPGKPLQATLGYGIRKKDTEDWYVIRKPQDAVGYVEIGVDTLHLYALNIGVVRVLKQAAGSEQMVQIASQRFERSAGVLNFTADDAQANYYVCVPRSSGQGGYLICNGVHQAEKGSPIRVTFTGRNAVRKGVPTEYQVTAKNVTGEPTGNFMLCAVANNDVKLLGAYIYDNGRRIYMPMDSIMYDGSPVAAFWIPSLAPYEQCGFTIVAEGVGDISYAKPQRIVGTTVALGVCALSYAVTKAITSDAAKEFIAEELALPDDQKRELARAKGLPSNYYITERKGFKPDFSARNVTKTIITETMDKVPVLKPIATAGGLLETLSTFASTIRLRWEYWCAVETGLINPKSNMKVTAGQVGCTDIVASFDPNEMVGPAGSGEEHYIADTHTVDYRILFENKAEAGAPAWRVRVFDELDENVFDVNSVSFGPTSHDQGYNWSMTREGNKLVWDIKGIELPPNVKAPEGEGYVSFSVNLKPGLADGTRIANKATIIFDKNQPIETNTYVNTLDLTAPVTTMGAATFANGDTAISVNCTAADAASGTSSYYYYVSRNGGDYNLAGISNNGRFAYPVPKGDKADYSFYALAVDWVGNTEQTAPMSVSTTTDGISQLDRDRTDGPAYNLSGQRVGKSYRGVVIRNGRKHIQR